MKHLILLFTLMFVLNGKSQSIDLFAGGMNISVLPDIKHENELATALFSTANLFVSSVNIYRFKETRRKSNAGFLLFPGLFQLSMGALFKNPNDPTRYIDVAVGSSSAFICIARMVYKPKSKSDKTAVIIPYCVPARSGIVSGVSFNARF